MHASDKLGLVLVDRSTLPVGGGNITLSFGAYPDELPGRVRFLHPLHNFAIISYDPTRLSHQVSQELKALLCLCVCVCVCVCVCLRTQLERSLMLAVLLMSNIRSELPSFISGGMCFQIIDIRLPCHVMFKAFSSFFNTNRK